MKTEKEILEQLSFFKKLQNKLNEDDNVDLYIKKRLNFILQNSINSLQWVLIGEGDLATFIKMKEEIKKIDNNINLDEIKK